MAKAYTIREVQLKPGVSPETFVAFVRKESALLEQFPGQQIRILQGQRGQREGKFLLLVEFESVERWRELSPTPGERNADYQRWHDTQEVPAFRRLQELAEVGPYTVYAEVADGQ